MTAPEDDEADQRPTLIAAERERSGLAQEEPGRRRRPARRGAGAVTVTSMSAPKPGWTLDAALDLLAQGYRVASTAKRTGFHPPHAQHGAVAHWHAPAPELVQPGGEGPGSPMPLLSSGSSSVTTAAPPPR